ncbi:VOC family protein [Kitasatospora aureofaciens]|uniref:VOC family protein n=1 Tax=Kitasatospora aureofaciens TaxID=1894 RepID=UPI0036F4756C
MKRQSRVPVITLFVADVPAARAYYQEVFGLPVVHQDSAAHRAAGVTVVRTPSPPPSRPAVRHPQSDRAPLGRVPDGPAQIRPDPVQARVS